MRNFTRLRHSLRFKPFPEIPKPIWEYLEYLREVMQRDTEALLALRKES